MLTNDKLLLDGRCLCKVGQFQHVLAFLAAAVEIYQSRLKKMTNDKPALIISIIIVFGHFCDVCYFLLVCST